MDCNIFVVSENKATGEYEDGEHYHWDNSRLWNGNRTCPFFKSIEDRGFFGKLFRRNPYRSNTHMTESYVNKRLEESRNNPVKHGPCKECLRYQDFTGAGCL
jgi:hypothetical protein